MKLFTFICFMLSMNINAIVTKNCPQTLEVMFAAPSIEKSYAIDAYEDFFKREGVVGAELKLASTANSECYYKTITRDNYISSVTLTGSMRKGAKNPATLIARMNLPVKGKTSNEIGSAIVYVELEALDKSGIQTSDYGKLYYASEYCSYGDCGQDHVYLGTFDEVVAE